MSQLNFCQLYLLPISIYLLILSRVSIGESYLSQLIAINFIIIQTNKTLNQVYNAKLYLKKLKALHLKQVIEKKPRIKKFYLDDKENNCYQG